MPLAHGGGFVYARVMTKFEVFKVGGIGWVASCTHVWTSAIAVCSCKHEFKTWQEAFDYAFKAAISAYLAADEQSSTDYQ